MNRLHQTLAFLLLVLSVPVMAQQGPANADDQEERFSDQSNEHRRFWEASLSGGHYMVALDRLANISLHEYVLDGTLYVREVTIDTNGRALARFYYIEPVTDGMGRNELKQAVDRGRQLVDRVANRAGSNIQNMAQKKYPDTTHAGTIEFRVLDSRDLDALYGSLRRAWESGRGRTFTIR
jgi:hypothetical protein